MKTLKEKEMDKITDEIQLEFPEDRALQQIHIARKVIAKEAEMKGLKYLEYIKILTKNLNDTH